MQSCVIGIVKINFLENLDTSGFCYFVLKLFEISVSSFFPVKDGTCTVQSYLLHMSPNIAHFGLKCKNTCKKHPKFVGENEIKCFSNFSHSSRTV